MTTIHVNGSNPLSSPASGNLLTGLFRARVPFLADCGRQSVSLTREGEGVRLTSHGAQVRRDGADATVPWSCIRTLEAGDGTLEASCRPDSPPVLACRTGKQSEAVVTAGKDAWKTLAPLLREAGFPTRQEEGRMAARHAEGEILASDSMLRCDGHDMPMKDILFFGIRPGMLLIHMRNDTFRIFRPQPQAPEREKEDK